VIAPGEQWVAPSCPALRLRVQFSWLLPIRSCRGGKACLPGEAKPALFARLCSFGKILDRELKYSDALEGRRGRLAES
jgi:hypothetical protein